jgi:hypothetical protein
MTIGSSMMSGACGGHAPDPKHINYVSLDGKQYPVHVRLVTVK